MADGSSSDFNALDGICHQKHNGPGTGAMIEVEGTEEFEAEMKTKPWRDIRARRFSPRTLKEIDRAVENELLEMDLKELREAAGKTQEELAEALKKAQSEISRIESRSD